MVNDVLVPTAERKIFTVSSVFLGQVSLQETGDAWYPAGLFVPVDPIDELIEAVSP